MEEVAEAALKLPKVLEMPAAAVVQRAKEVEVWLKVRRNSGKQNCLFASTAIGSYSLCRQTNPKRARELCCSSPTLLLVPKGPLEAKLKAMSMATGMDMEACCGMLTVHMFK